MDFTKNINKQYINGSWVEGSGDDVIVNKNPYNQEKLQEIKAASKSDVDQAYKAAKEASTSWANSLPQERSQVVMKFSEALEKNKDKMQL